MRVRIVDQAWATVDKTNAKPGDIILPFQYRKIEDGICPTLTTRPEGLKTMILILEEGEE